MKSNKSIIIILISVIFLSCTNVYAGEYSIKQLIPIDDNKANVFSKTFNYSGVKFETGSDGKVNGILKFDNITNNTSSRKPPSFNILLFDGGKKNIGYITYCAEKDYGSDNSMFYIPGKESRPFKINVTTRYFGGNEKNYKGIVHEPGEIVYYSFFSDNSYCQIGGYINYIGLTNEEIIGGEVNIDNEKIKEKLKMNELILYLPYFLIGFVGLIGYGLFLNILYKRMHARTSILSYLPMTNIYIAVKLAFGKKIAWIFYILSLISLFIVYSYSKTVFIYILCIIVAIATFIDIFKLITGKYDIFVFGKKHKNDSLADNTFSTNNCSRFIDGGNEIEEKDTQIVTANDFLNNINNGINDTPQNEQPLVDSNDIVDISYASDVPIYEDNGFDVKDNTDLDIEDNNLLNDEGIVNVSENNLLAPVSNVTTLDNTVSNVTTSDNTVSGDASSLNNTVNDNISNSIPRLDDEKSGESELSNFFR